MEEPMDQVIQEPAEEEKMDISSSWSCQYCRKQLVRKRLFSIKEAAFLLNAHYETTLSWVRRGLLPSRLWPRSRGSLRRVIDARDIETFVEEFFPRCDAIRPDSPNPRVRQIWKMIEWYRANGRKGAAVRWNKVARERSESPSVKE